jgi:hypothetical protein
MQLIRRHSSTSNVLRVVLRNSTTGAGLTGLTFESAGLIISTITDNEASATSYTVTGGTIETISTLGTFAAPTDTKCRFKEVDATNHPGLYELQLADARFAVASAKQLDISILGAASLLRRSVTIQLDGVDVGSISGDTTAADTLELFAEALDQSTGQLDSGTLHDDTITAASIATGALTADAFAADAIVAATLATGCLTADAFAADAIVAATLATGAITADAFAADALVAATFATGALTADAFAANAIVAATLADDCITAAKINTGAITADAFAADALVAATFATGALTADALASTATDAIAAAAFQEWLTSEHVFYVVAAPPA